MTDFTRLTIEEIVGSLAKGSISPSDVAEICIARVKGCEPLVQAWASFDGDALLSQARAVTRRMRSGASPRLLEAIPVGVKDIFNTRDFPTEMGSPVWKGFTPGNDARVVYHLRKEGGLIPGKTTTAEFAVHTLLAKTLNPHAAERTPGTSSSGSAVSVAVGMVPLALGTQTAGSIGRPASYCGVYAFKPSYGTIPRTGILKTTDTLDSVGFFVAHGKDVLRCFEVVRVHGPNYPWVHRYLENEGMQRVQEKLSRNEPWNVAFVKTPVWEYARSESRLFLEELARRMDALPGVRVHWIVLPEEMNEAHDVHKVLYHRSLSYYFHEEAKDRLRISPVMRAIIEEGDAITLEQYIQAEEKQKDIQRAMDSFLSSYDVLLSLGTAGRAPLREEEEARDPCLMWTLSHVPAMSIPGGVSPEGLPFGVQCVAKKYNDYLLIEFCNEMIDAEIFPKGVFPRQIMCD